MHYHRIEDPQDHAYERILLLISRFNQEIGKNYKKYLDTFLDTYSNIASGAAAFLSLPKESSDRRAVIKAFLQGQTRDFSDEALVALSDYLENLMPVRAYLGQDWRQWMSYPRAVEARIGEKMDDMARLIGPSDASDRYSRMTDLLDEAEIIGLIDGNEKTRLRSILGPEM